MDNDRLKHSYAVAKKMMELAKLENMNNEEINICFLIGFNHDIGYDFVENGINHNIVGGNLLKESGFKYWKEVYYHGILQDEYKSKYLDILNRADMMIDKYGNDVGYDKRLEDIESRYGKNSKIYDNCFKLIKKIR